MFLSGISTPTKNPVLFLGEGNFSFSASVVKMMVGLGESSDKVLFNHIWSSCFESDPSKFELNEKNEEAAVVKEENKSFLLSRGCRVLDSLDAAHLEEDWRLSDIFFSKIIFMFPHVGGKMKIDKNRRLLLNIIRSSRKVLSADGEIIITLCKGGNILQSQINYINDETRSIGQGGTPFELVKRPPSDTWKIIDLINEADCILTKVEFFPSELFEDYRQVGYRGLHKKFNVTGSVIHTIRKMEPRELSPISEISGEPPSSTSTGQQQESESECFKSLYPLHHVHHLSFWLPKAETSLDDSVVVSVLKETRVEEILVSWRTVELYSQQDRHSQTIELEFSDPARPLGHSRMVDILINVLGKSLESCGQVSLR